MINISSGTFRLFIQFKSDGTLPKFRGSTIRGALGYQLKKTLFHTEQKDCNDCLIAESCLYKKIFEGAPPSDRDILRKYPTIPQPFVLDVSPSDEQQVKSGDSYCFSIRLFGESISHLPYIVYSLIEIGKKGLGKNRIPFELKKVVQILKTGEEKEIYSYQDSNMAKPIYEELALNNDNNNYRGKLKIKFVTPTKYRHKGSLSTDTSFNVLFKTIARRTKIMCYFYGNSLEGHFDKQLYDLAEQIKTVKNNTKLTKFTRISGRQNKKIKMSGIIGETIYEGDFNGLLPYLKACETLNVGKSTSFGFGKVNIDFKE